MLRRGFKKKLNMFGLCKSKLLPLSLTYAKAVVRERDNQVGLQTHPTQTQQITIVLVTRPPVSHNCDVHHSYYYSLHPISEPKWRCFSRNHFRAPSQLGNSQRHSRNCGIKKFSTASRSSGRMGEEIQHN